MTMPIWRKLVSVALLLLTLYIISDDSFSVFTALKGHDPSLRIFQSLLEVTLALFCASLSLHLWTRAIGTSYIEKLLFQPPSILYNLRDYRAISRSQDQIQQLDVVSGKDDEEILEEEMGSDILQGSSNDDIPDTLQPPSATSVLNAALDLLQAILVTLFLYTLSAVGYFTDSHSLQFISEVAAPIFPLILFVYLAIKAFFPWENRLPFWLVIANTLGAPWTDVQFRDGFIGDIITSSVRPLQDIAFTTVYLLSGLKGWWSFGYSVVDSADASIPAMERSWILHTAILPMCMVSPLWWRFLQNLRQCYDNKKRWPYLGNALKYFVAAQVAVVGVFWPNEKNSVLWLTSFAVATLYQVWWDIMMDWELIERKDGDWKLRSTRLYKSKSFYWIICFVNVALRFCWTLSFMPERYLNAAGMLQENFSSLLGPLIASAEIIRRSLWGLLRFELEAIKLRRIEHSKSDEEMLEKHGDKTVEMSPMKVHGEERFGVGTAALSADMSRMNDVQILGELSLYASVFAVLGFLAAAHRETM